MKTRVLRYTPLAAVLAIPSLGIAASDSSLTGSTLKVTITLNASVTGSLYLKVLDTATGLTDTTQSEAYNFGTVNPGTGGRTPVDPGGSSAHWDNGTAYFIQPHAELYYTGYDSASVQGAVTSFTHAGGGNGVDAKAYLGCTGSASTAAGTGHFSWGSTSGTNGGSFPGPNFAGGTTAQLDLNAAATASSACFADSTHPGTALFSNLDLGMFFADSAPVGAYQAKFTFTATVAGS